LCIERLCTQGRWNPELVNVFGAAARYRRAIACRSHADARPDKSALQTGKIQSCYFPADETASRRRGNDLGTTIKYLRKTTSGAAGIGLVTTINCRLVGNFPIAQSPWKAPHAHSTKNVKEIQIMREKQMKIFANHRTAAIFRTRARNARRVPPRATA
jgi:hypothetical protein